MAASVSWSEAASQPVAGAGALAGLRGELYLSLGRRRDALFEACDALACRPERVHMLAELSLEPECRRGHGSLYGALNCGDVRTGRLRMALPALPLPAWDDGRIRLACDVGNWLRPGAETSPERLLCHCYARGEGSAQLIPGWPYSWVAALEPGRTSWALPLDAVRLGPADDATLVTAAQLREVITRIITAGRWREGDPDIIIVVDADYDLTRLAWQRPASPATSPRTRPPGVPPHPPGLPSPASAPKPTRPGPGRPAGSRNQRPATRHDAGKTVKREEPAKKTRKQQAR